MVPLPLLCGQQAWPRLLDAARDSGPSPTPNWGAGVGQACMGSALWKDSLSCLSASCNLSSLEQHPKRHFFICWHLKNLGKCMFMPCLLMLWYFHEQPLGISTVTLVLGEYVVKLCPSVCGKGCSWSPWKCSDFVPLLTEENIYYQPNLFLRTDCFHVMCTDTSGFDSRCFFLINCMWNEHPSQRDYL